MVTAVVVVALFSVSALCVGQMKSARMTLSNQLLAEQEVLYLPGGKGLEFMSFGYRNMLSKVLWFKTISYFGKHFGGDRNYQWLYHMCGLVSELDPRAVHVYKFCSMMLAWEASQPQKSQQVLNRAISQFPNSWEFYYYRGILSYLFLEDPEGSRRDLKKAADLPGAPVVVRRLAAKNLAAQDPSTAIEFLQSMIEKSGNGAERKALDQRLREAVYERDARTVEQAIAVYENRFGKQPADLKELVDAGIVSHLNDPFGGVFERDLKTGQIKSSTGKSRLVTGERREKAEIRKRWDSVDVRKASD
jgi:tetratricopeptide (TPR) repeat protein